MSIRQKPLTAQGRSNNERIFRKPRELVESLEENDAPNYDAPVGKVSLFGSSYNYVNTCHDASVVSYRYSTGVPKPGHYLVEMTDGDQGVFEFDGESWYYGCRMGDEQVNLVTCPFVIVQDQRVLPPVPTEEIGTVEDLPYPLREYFAECREYDATREDKPHE